MKTDPMHYHHQPDLPAPQPVLAAMVAEFQTPRELIEAARKVRDAGYQKFDAHSPFPVHGIDDAMGIRMSRLPWFTFGAAVFGGLNAVGMQWWMNTVDYPFWISGKPFASIPAWMPIIFELCILLGCFTTVIVMFLLNGLPRFASPFSRAVSTLRSSSDRFFVSLDARDPKFSLEGSRQLLESIGARHVEACYIDPADAKFPKALVFGAIMLGSVLVVPPVAIAKHRWEEKRIPKVHWIQDMDFQTKFKTQKANKFFADGRSMRQEVVGTIARGDLEDDDKLFKGLEHDDGTLERLLNAPPAAPAAPQPAPAGGAPAAQEPDPLDALPWVKTVPIPVTLETLKRGEERYNIYCSVCHGIAGDGDGLVTLRAMELQQGTWIKPVSYHTENVRNQPIGRLFNTVTHGVRKMSAMGDVVTVQDRWAILLYLRALQKTRTGDPADVPADVLPELKDVKFE